MCACALLASASRTVAAYPPPPPPSRHRNAATIAQLRCVVHLAQHDYWRPCCVRAVPCSPLPADAVALKQLGSDDVVAAVATMLNIISAGSANVPTRLPGNVAVRHRVCTSIANSVKVRHTRRCHRRTVSRPAALCARGLQRCDMRVRACDSCRTLGTRATSGTTSCSTRTSAIPDA